MRRVASITLRPSPAGWQVAGCVADTLTVKQTIYANTIVQDGVHFHDLHATILHLLGLDHTRLTYRHAGRDYRLTDVHGMVVKGLRVGDSLARETATKEVRRSSGRGNLSARRQHPTSTIHIQHPTSNSNIHCQHQEEFAPSRWLRIVGVYPGAATTIRVSLCLDEPSAFALGPLRDRRDLTSLAGTTSQCSVARIFRGFGVNGGVGTFSWVSSSNRPSSTRCRTPA
jgi:hypothetical protein